MAVRVQQRALSNTMAHMQAALWFLHVQPAYVPHVCSYIQVSYILVLVHTCVMHTCSRP